MIHQMVKVLKVVPRMIGMFPPWHSGSEAYQRAVRLSHAYGLPGRFDLHDLHINLKNRQRGGVAGG